MKQKLLKSYGLRVLLLAFSLLMGGALFNNAWAEEVTYDFTKIDGFSSWSSAYSKHDVSYTEATVSFAYANKQTSTITDRPVTKGQPVSLVMKGTRILSSVTFVCTQWGSKAQTITLKYSTDNGTNYSTLSPSVTSTNFTITCASLPSGTNAVQISFSNSSNQVGIASATINYTTPDASKVSTPSISIPSGAFVSSKTVTIECETDDATIYYTTNGSKPTTSSTEYTGPFTLDVTTTVKAIAVKDGLTDSDVASQTFTKETVLDGISALNAASNGTYYVDFDEAQITYVNGSNGFLNDGTSAAVCYWTTPTVKTTYDGIYQVVKTTFNGMPEYTSITNVEGTTTTPNTVQSPTVMTVSELDENFIGNAARQIQINNYTVTDADKLNENINLHTSYESVSLSVGDTYTLVGYPFKTNTGQDFRVVAATLKPATPTFDPVEDEFNSTFTLHLDCATAGATIYYTTNGDTPTSSSTAYDDEDGISISTTTTVKAIAIKSGSSSDVAEATYTYKAILKPTFTPSNGSSLYYGETVAIDATDGATIYYTTDNSTPTTSSSVYSSPIAINSATTIKAFAKKGSDESSISTAAYTLKTPDAPTFNVVAGDVTRNTVVTITSRIGTTIYYTTDGTDPEDAEDSEKNSVSVTIDEAKTVRAICVDGDANISSETSAEYTIIQVATPTFSEDAGYVEDGTTVSISCETEGVTIYYTTDGSTPTTSSTVYSAAITLNSDQTLKALAVKSNYRDSEIASAAYTIITDETYVLVTNVSDLKDGDIITFVNQSSGKAIGTANTNNYSATTVSISSNSFTLLNNNTSVTLVTLEKDGQYYYFKNSSGKYIGAASSSSNYMKADSKTDNKKATVSITSGNATITFQGSYTHKYMRYNSSSSLFSCYSSSTSENPVQIYKHIIPEDAELIFASSTANATYGSVFSGPVLTNEHSASISWTSSDEDVATVASDGTITLVAAGETTITATATGMYTGSASYTLTVTRASTSLAFASSTAKTFVGESTYQQTASITPSAADNTISYAFSGEHGDATINTSNGTVTFNGFTGDLTIQASAEQTDKYGAPSTTSYTLTVSANPTATLTLSSTSESTTYGTNVVLDCSFADGYLDEDDADVIGTGYNSSIADFSFDKGTGKITITPAAVGSTTFTFKADAVGDYEEGSTVNFTLSVNEPSPYSTLPMTITKTTFTDKDLNYESGGIAWSASKSANQLESSGSARGVQFGAGIGTFTLSTSAISGTITKVSMVVSTNGSSNTISVKVGEEDFKYNDAKTLTLTSGDSKVTRDFVGEASGDIVISCNDANKSIYFKSITVTIKTDVDVTINKYGYATYCSEYPIDFSLTSGYTAWRVSDIDADGTITFNKITEKIKGGQGVLLYNKNADGENKSSATITFADGTTEFTSSENMLMGTTAPKYVEAETVYGLSGDKFVVNNVAGNIPANRAFIEASSIPAEVKNFTFVFEDETTGITETRKATREEVDAIFNLSGQKLNKMQRGINIVNGKKVIIK